MTDDKYQQKRNAVSEFLWAPLASGLLSKHYSIKVTRHNYGNSQNGCLNSIWTRLAIREGGPRIWHFTGSGFVCIPEQAIHSVKIFWISDFHGLSRFFHAHGCFVHWLEFVPP